jgi:cytidylate kinase
MRPWQVFPNIKFPDEFLIVIVTIDGPAGAGKSSIAHRVAEQLGFEFLDTGAMYRAVTLAAQRAGLALDDAEMLSQFVASLDLRWVNQCILLDGEDVSEEIRSPDVTAAIRFVADNPSVREQLSAHMRRIANGRDVVTEGRDQGTEVFPDAHCKVFLTASPEERAKRRQQQLAQSGRKVSFVDVLVAQNKRDLEDRMRPVGRLRAASDAIVIQSDNLTPDEVLQTVLQRVEERIAQQRAH